MASIPSGAAFFGLLASTYATGFFPNLDVQAGAAKNIVVQAPPLDAAVQTMLLVAAALGAFNAAVRLIYARLYNAAAATALDRRIPQVVYLTLFASSGLLVVVPQPGAIDGGHDLLPLAVPVVGALRPAAAAATFFLSVTLIYAHVRAVGEGGADAVAAGNVPILPIIVSLLTKLVLAAALLTVVLTLTSTVLASYAG
uniref:Uncharacterized protein n=1 Tax=Oryza brachyantha TaxID=4533 RepID=J3MC55_ORYBR